MTIDEAIHITGPEKVREIIRSGHAQDAGHPDSFRGRATRAALRGHPLDAMAHTVLAAQRECDVWQATKSAERLEREFLEDGSGRAYAEMVRRGLPLPQSAALQPAWL